MTIKSDKWIRRMAEQHVPGDDRAVAQVAVDGVITSGPARAPA